MIVPLAGKERRSLAHASLALCSASVLLAAMTFSRSAAADGQAALPPSRLVAPSVPDRLVYPRLIVHRDPFEHATALPDGAYGVADPSGIALPPNAGLTPDVRAVVLGAAPRALVDAAGDAYVVRIGSALSGSFVTGIDDRGLTLADGRRLPLAPGRP